MQLAVLPPFQRELIPLEIHVHEQRGINTLGNYSKTQYDLEYIYWVIKYTNQ